MVRLARLILVSILFIYYKYSKIKYLTLGVTSSLLYLLLGPLTLILSRKGRTREGK